MTASASRPHPLAVVFALLVLYLVWGSTYLAMRFAMAAFPPALMAGLRFSVAGAAVVLFLRMRGTPWPTWAQWRSAGLVGALLLVSGNGLVAWAEQRVASGLAAVVVATVPLWVGLLSALFGKRPSRMDVLGILVGGAGVVLLNLDGDLRAHPLYAALLLFASASWALGSVLSPRLDLPKGPMASGAQMLCAGPVLLLLGALHGDRLPSSPRASAVLALGYLVVFGSILAFTAYGFLLRTVRPVLATSYAYVNPVVAVGLGALFAGEHIAPVAYAGIALIVAAVVLVAVTRNAPSKG